MLPAENSLTLANKYPRLVQLCEDLAGGWLLQYTKLLLPGLALTCELSLTWAGVACIATSLQQHAAPGLLSCAGQPPGRGLWERLALGAAVVVAAGGLHSC